MCKRRCRRGQSQPREEVGACGGGAGLVASPRPPVPAEGHIEALVNKRLVGVVVVGQQRLPELALVNKEPLEKRNMHMSRSKERRSKHATA